MSNNNRHPDDEHPQQQQELQKPQSMPLRTAKSQTAKSDDNTTLPPIAEAEIATGLKRLYGQMLAEPLPDRFSGLLEQLAKGDRNSEPK
jgi:hypothetical protein